jgi:NADPH:quinone reductase-like Zn-dependent oxidoreductase
MKAIQLTSHGAPGQWRFANDVPDPVAGAGEVVVRVRACGLNRLDLWMEEGKLPITVPLPRIPGGEIAGEVLELGPGVTDWKLGEAVAVQSNLFCGECEFCARGEESICIKGKLLGVERDGGFAEKVAVPASALVRMPQGVDFVASASLTLAGSTAMHMLTQRAPVHQGDWVLVIAGASGVGSAAIQIARELGAYVIATGSTDAKRQFALERGAGHVVDSSTDDWPAEVRKITGKRGVDIVVEHVGGETLNRCFTCLARGGAVVTCGATAGRDVSLSLWPLFVKEHRLIGSYGRSRKDISATLKWLAAGKLKPAVFQTFPLAETPAAYEILRNRTVIGKAVITT